MTKINHSAIQCAADAVTAEEYDIWLGGKLYRVTAYNAEDAREAAMEHLRNWNDSKAAELRDSQADLPL